MRGSRRQSAFALKCEYFNLLQLPPSSRQELPPQRREFRVRKDPCWPSKTMFFQPFPHALANHPAAECHDVFPQNDPARINPVSIVSGLRETGFSSHHRKRIESCRSAEPYDRRRGQTDLKTASPDAGYPNAWLRTSVVATRP